MANIINGENEDYTAMCRLFRDGTQLRKPGSCSEYIDCYNSTGVVRTCASPTSLFDSTRQSCVDSYASSTKNFCSDLCENVNVTKTQWVADPTNCHGYVYCGAGISMAGTRRIK